MTSLRIHHAVFGAALVAASLVAHAAPAQAPFTSLNIFGDSLSDTGNVFLASGGTQPPAGQPYVGGAFSNGPLWTDLLSVSLGRPAGGTASLAGGTNYAWAGARASGGSTPSTLVQTLNTAAGFWGSVAGDPTGLYVLLAGGNDMRDARSAFPSLTLPSDIAGRQAAAQAAITSLGQSLTVMAGKGVKNVMLSNLPDLGNTPEANALGLAAVSSDSSGRFNLLMPGLLAQAGSLGLNVSFLDLAGLLTAVRSDALTNAGAVYGVTNVTTPCAGFTGSLGISCNVSLFSDALHPSARAHQLIASAALVTVVPEPASMLLMAMGICALLAWRRRA